MRRSRLLGASSFFDGGICVVSRGGRLASTVHSCLYFTTICSRNRGSPSIRSLSATRPSTSRARSGSAARRLFEAHPVRPVRPRREDGDVPPLLAMLLPRMDQQALLERPTLAAQGCSRRIVETD